MTNNVFDQYGLSDQWQIPAPTSALHIFNGGPLVDGQFILQPGASLKYENTTNKPVTVTVQAADGKVVIGYGTYVVAPKR